MKRYFILLLLPLLFGCNTQKKSSANFQNNDLSVAERAYLSFPEFRMVTLSPNDEFAVVSIHSNNQSKIATYHRKSKKILTAFSPGKNFQVQRFIWVDNEKIIVIGEYVNGYLTGDFRSQYLFSFQRDGTNFRQVFPKRSHHARIDYTAQFFRVLSDKILDDRFLLVLLSKYDQSGPKLSLQKLDIFRSELSLVDKVPMKSGDYALDNKMRGRIAFSVDEKGRLQTFSKHLGNSLWTPIKFWNWYSRSFKVLGFNERNDKFYFLADNRKSVQSLYSARIDNAGKITNIKKIFSNPNHDILSTHWDEESHEPLYVEYGPGFPERKYLGSSPLSQFAQNLDGIFAKERVYFSKLDEGDNILRVVSDTRPQTYYMLKHGRKDVVEFLSSNEKVRSLPISSNEYVSFRTNDGFEINGFLKKPLNWTTKTPMIVYIHGGPFGVREDWSYSGDIEFLVANGFSVLRLNFRGSDGQGYQFEKAGYRQIGLKMIDDITDGVKWAVSKNLVQPGNACAWGISYGGYASIHSALRYPDLFKCAAGFGGIYEWSTSLNEGDSLGNQWSKRYWNRRLPKSSKEQYQQSPLAHIKSLSRNLLIMHGKKDVRCSVSQARRLKKSLEKYGKSFEYKEFPNVGHWFKDDQGQKYQAFEKLKLFFNKNLKTKKAKK